jgi:hypothetical protein
MKNLRVFRLFIWLGCICFLSCRPSGVMYGQWKFYPNNAKLEDPNKHSVLFMTESINGDIGKCNIKKYYLTVNDDRIPITDKKRLLYSEEGEITIAMPEINISWGEFEKITIITTGNNGVKIFERTLKYDMAKKIFLK